jgi:hypothetical protein
MRCCGCTCDDGAYFVLVKENLPDIIGRLHVAQVRLLHRATDQSLAEHTAATAESVRRSLKYGCVQCI